MRRILSLLMALVLATGVCVLISSCGEADDTSSSNEASDVPAGREILLASEIGGDWNDVIVTEKIKPMSIVTAIGSEIEPAFGYAAFNIRKYDFIKDILFNLEKHIVCEITEDDFGKNIVTGTVHIYDADLQSQLHASKVPDISSVASDKMIDIDFNKDGIIISTADGSAVKKAYFKLDTDSSEFVEAIKRKVTYLD